MVQWNCEQVYLLKQYCDQVTCVRLQLQAWCWWLEIGKMNVHLSIILISTMYWLSVEIIISLLKIV